MTNNPQPTAPEFSATISCPPEHAEAFRDICAQLEGKISTILDGSLTCDFTVPPSGGLTSVLRSFNVNENQVTAGRALCSQLGGRFAATDSGAKCEFFLPLDPQWSINPLSENAILVRFDIDTSYTAAAIRDGILLQAFQSGRLIERISLVQSPANDSFDVTVTDAEGTKSTLRVLISEGRVRMSLSFDGKLVFECEDSVHSIQHAFAASYAMHRECRPDVPYLKLLLTKINDDLRFREHIEPFLGIAKRPVEGPVLYFCVAACGLCTSTGDPHACVACSYCLTRFTAAPPGID